MLLFRFRHLVLHLPSNAQLEGRLWSGSVTRVPLKAVARPLQYLVICPNSPVYHKSLIVHCGFPRHNPNQFHQRVANLCD